jgi:hypothetical protein
MPHPALPRRPALRWRRSGCDTQSTGLARALPPPDLWITQWVKKMQAFVPRFSVAQPHAAPTHYIRIYAVKTVLCIIYRRQFIHKRRDIHAATARRKACG